MHGIIFVIVFGLLLAIIPLAVTFFLPVRQAGVFVAWLAMLAFLITLVPTGADYSPTTGLSGRVALAQMMFVPVALGVILGGGLRLFLATRDSVSLATTSPARGAEEYASLWWSTEPKPRPRMRPIASRRRRRMTATSQSARSWICRR